MPFRGLSLGPAGSAPSLCCWLGGRLGGRLPGRPPSSGRHLRGDCVMRAKASSVDRTARDRRKSAKTGKVGPRRGRGQSAGTSAPQLASPRSGPRRFAEGEGGLSRELVGGGGLPPAFCWHTLSVKACPGGGSAGPEGQHNAPVDPLEGSRAVTHGRDEVRLAGQLVRVHRQLVALPRHQAEPASRNEHPPLAGERRRPVARPDGLHARSLPPRATSSSAVESPRRGQARPAAPGYPPPVAAPLSRRELQRGLACPFTISFPAGGPGYAITCGGSC